MDFSSLVAKKVQELMQQKDISTYKLEELSGVYSSTITAFLTSPLFYPAAVLPAT